MASGKTIAIEVATGHPDRLVFQLTQIDRGRTGQRHQASGEMAERGGEIEKLLPLTGAKPGHGDHIAPLQSQSVSLGPGIEVKADIEPLFGKGLAHHLTEKALIGQRLTDIRWPLAHSNTHRLGPYRNTACPATAQGQPCPLSPPIIHPALSSLFC